MLSIRRPRYWLAGSSPLPGFDDLQMPLDRHRAVRQRDLVDAFAGRGAPELAQWWD